MGSITCGAPEDVAAHGPLPVTIRSGEGEVIGRGVTGAPIAVLPGRYYASVLLPDGREIGADDAIAVSIGADETCTTGPCAIGSVASALQSDAPAPPMAMADAPPQINAAIWRGAWLDLWDADDPVAPPLGEADTRLSTAEPSALEGSTREDQLLAIPVESASGPMIRFSIIPYDLESDSGGAAARQILANLNLGSGSPQIDFRTASNQVNTLLSLVEANVLTNMMRVTSELVKRADAGINVASISVLGTITGCYVLLRGNILDGVPSWLDQIEAIEPGLPDVAIIRVEMLGRLGRHQEAVAILKATLIGRMPWFRSGLSYWLERLRLYVDVTNNPDAPFALSPEDKARFKVVRNRLEHLLPLMDNGRHMATFDIPVRAA